MVTMKVEADTAEAEVQTEALIITEDGIRVVHPVEGLKAVVALAMGQ